MLHKKLLPNERGYFRTVPVWVGGREGKPWAAIPELVRQWVVNANDLVKNGKNDSNHFLHELIKIHHVRYEAIHPFTDGNGRTGRMLMNWERIKLGFPIIVILEKEKQKYYDWFN
jgi:Fic family protein